MRICLIDNMPAQYRKAIYMLMDSEFDMDWYFGEPFDGIASFDTSVLKNVKNLKTIKRKHLPGYWIDGMSKAIDNHDLVIMIGEPGLWSTWALLIKRVIFHRNRHVAFWTHGWYGKESRLKAAIKKLYFKLGTEVITYGEYARQLMIKEGFDGNKLFAIHNSLDYQKQLSLRSKLKASDIYKKHFGNDFPTLIFIGRLTSVKRLDLLIEALALLRDKGERYNLSIVGDGVEADALKELVKQKSLTDSVWFYGACYNEEENAELIFNADLCVAPGNIGLTAMHVLTYGCPAATHDNFPYQMPEFEAIHEGITGTFFKQNNHEDIARAITRWFAEKADCRDEVRQECYREIDQNWTPGFQVNVLKKLIEAIR